MHKEMIRVEGHSGLFRDKSTNAIINTDKSEYQKYINAKKSKENMNNRINQNTNDINTIKEDISIIKGMIELLLNNRNI